MVLSPAARQDIQDILHWSIAKFGVNAAVRYRVLLTQALRDIGADPMRAGSRIRPELTESARTYHLAFSHSQVANRRVKAPRHFILYGIGADNLKIVRILHDRCDLTRHLPEDYSA